MFPFTLPDALVQAGGWTILHSLWQGAVITLLLAFFLGRTRERSPELRYQLSVGALLALLGGTAATFFYYYEPASGAGAVSGEGAWALSPAVPEAAAVATGYQDDLSRLFPWLLQVWIIGVALMSIRMLVELVYLQRLRSVHTQSVRAHWLERLHALRRQMNLRQPVLLRESWRVNSPLLVGWIKPIILLPVGMLSGLSPEQVECVLAHELAHVRRMDYLVNLLQSAVEVVLFFHPAVWWISAQIREEREHCCDELAVAVTGNRLTLVKTLAQLEEWRLQGGRLGLAFNGRPQGVLGRVQRLLGGESSVRIIGKGLWALLFFCLATGLLAFRERSEPSEEVTGQWADTSLGDVRPPQPRQIPARATEVLPSTVAAAAKVNPDVRAKPSVSSREETPVAAPVKRLRPEDIQLLVRSGLEPLTRSRDTIPDEQYRKAMRELQKEMETLQREMMNSEEMQKIKELTQLHETEMRALQEKMMKEQGGYEQLMQEQRKLMEGMERRHREITESETYRAMQAEGQKMAEVFSRQAEEIARRFRDDPELLNQKMDSLSRTFEVRQEVLEEQFEATFENLEKEMEALENSPEMKALESKMEAMNEQLEVLMENRMEPLEEELEVLQRAMEEKFERQMERLQEQMEKLEYEYQQKERGRREE